MLVIASGSDIWWSGQTVAGEATWFSPAFQQPVDGAGSIVALATIDGSLVAFKEREVFMLSGSAPSDNGAQGGLSEPSRIASEVGCISPNSVVSTSMGVFFQSARGIELLNRGGSVSWVGEAIQDTLASFPVVSSAVLDDAAGLVRFTLVGGTSDGVVFGGGRTAVYDLSIRTWVSIDELYGQEEGGPAVAQDACMAYVGGRWCYVWLDTSGVVYSENDPSDEGAYLDGGTWVTMAAETSWFKLGGIQGHHHVNKVLLLGRQYGPADLSTSMFYDFETSARTAQVRLSTEVDALSTALDRLQFEHQMHDEAEGQAIKVRFEDGEPAGGIDDNGRGATWISITVEGTPRMGAVGVPEGGM
jgi:hypothetical protein